MTPRVVAFDLPLIATGVADEMGSRTLRSPLVAMETGA